MAYRLLSFYRGVYIGMSIIKATNMFWECILRTSGILLTMML